LEELLGTKLRALYQRRKGRDLYDMYKALVQVPDINKEALLQCYHAYMEVVVDEPPTQKVYLQNIEAKMQDDEFVGDIAALIRPTEKYDQSSAFDLVRAELLEKIEESKTKQTK
jgi:predicted nucleotidyltransferase component of viral defense system